MYVSAGQIATFYSMAGTNLAQVYQSTGGLTWAAAQQKTAEILRGWGWRDIQVSNDARGLVIIGTCPIDFNSQNDIAGVFMQAAAQAGFYFTGQPHIGITIVGHDVRGTFGGGTVTTTSGQRTGSTQQTGTRSTSSTTTNTSTGGIQLPQQQVPYQQQDTTAQLMKYAPFLLLFVVVSVVMSRR